VMMSASPAPTLLAETQPTEAMAQQLAQARQAYQVMATLSTAQKNEALRHFATLLRQHQPALLAANAKDLAENKDTLSPALYNRLKLDEAKLAQVIEGIGAVAALPDPCGKVLRKTLLDDGLVLEQRTVALGVIAIIFESRPDVLPQILSLILKSGDAVVFKGGSEAKHSNAAFMMLVDELSQACPFLPAGWATLLTTRDEIAQLLAYPQYVDLVIPRGSNELVQRIMASTRIPVLGHADGVCHIYVDASADLERALPVILDAKQQYPAACNALETLLVDAKIAADLLPRLQVAATEAGIALKAPLMLQSLLPQAQCDDEIDWHTEYGDLTLAVQVVDGLEAAIAHINRYGSHHTDGILSQDPAAMERFITAIDSASVFVNASTRFADGFRYGLGAEIGISTARTHARGPVGLEGLVSTKWVLQGHGQVVKTYVGAPAERAFKHQTMS
jgi:glutamate-5-semialdehyde dehydrogenase